MAEVTAVLLCGGGSSRFGADKLIQALGGTTVLGHLVDSLPSSWSIVAVGDERPLDRPVTWVLEDPRDGGPLDGIATGVDCVTSDLVVVLGGDMPFVGPWAERLAADLADPTNPTHTGVAGVCACGQDGRDNPLLAAYRTAAVRAALPEVTRDGRARLLLDRLHHHSMTVPDADLLDVDTPAALELARARLDPGSRRGGARHG